MITHHHIILPFYVQPTVGEFFHHLGYGLTDLFQCCCHAALDGLDAGAILIDDDDSDRPDAAASATSNGFAAFLLGVGTKPAATATPKPKRGSIGDDSGVADGYRFTHTVLLPSTFFDFS